MSNVLWVHQSPARCQYQTKCVKLQCALKTNEPTEGIIEPNPSNFGVSAEEGSISECDPADAMSYNDKYSTYIPKKVVAGCKNKAQLESFMKEAFDVPANRSVKLAFKPTGQQRKQQLKEYVAEQLSIAVAVYIDDAYYGSFSPAAQ